MSLDQNLYTLNFSQREDDRNVTDLVDSNGIKQYTKRRLAGNEYKIEVYDPLSEGLLATVTAPAATSKHKTLQLYNPDLVVELKYTGTITFKWGFKWEDHDYEWRREECYILRKPDPAVLIAVTKEPPGRLQTRTVQLLDYNLNRFDIADRKGLEIVLLTALMTFQDANEVYHTPREGNTPAATPAPTPAIATEPPAVPPRPEPRQGVERVAEMHAIRTAHGDGEANEIEVWEECSIDDYAHYAERLLNDEAMLFITIRSSSAAQVPKVLRVVEETKRLRHKSGVAEEEELHQYVIYDTEKSTPRKGPKRINLDDPEGKKGKDKDKDKYTPPASLTVHLSKIDMPELRPKSTLATSRRPSETGPGRASSPAPAPAPELSEKERRRIEKERQKAEKEAKKNKKNKGKEPSPPPPPGAPAANKLTKPTASSQPHNTYHTPAFQAHPYQPSPSPSQLNNPMIYSAPPPPPRPRPVSMAFPMPDAHAGRPQSFYGAGPGSYNAFPEPMDGHAPRGSGYQPGYVSSPQNAGPPTSSYQSSSGKGPVSALLEMWSKH